MTRVGLPLVIGGLLATAASAASADPAADARLFVSKVFAAEAGNNPPDFATFLSRRFRRAVEADRPDGEIGELDHDPLCQCQDSGGMHFSLVAIRPVATGFVTDIKAGGHRARWVLVHEDGGWKIADVFEAGRSGGGSMLGLLERSQHRRR